MTSSKTLLIVSVLRDGRRCRAWLAGGVSKTFTPQVPPYFWSLDSYSTNFGALRKVRRLLSKPRADASVWRVLCKTVYDVKRLSKQLSTSFETMVRYKERLAQDCGFVQPSPDQMATTDAAFDIEIESKGQFPRVDRNPVTAIAYVSRRYQQVWTKFDYPEYEILAKLCDTMRRDNTDIVGTFSGTALDYDYPKSRALVLGVDFPLGRFGDVPYTKTRTFQSGRRVGVEKTTYLRGRICYDLYREVLFDTSLTGVRHTLKDTCRFLFGDKFIIEVDRQRLDMLSKEELGAYCFSDARITFKLLRHYLMLIKPLASMLKIPLDMVVGRKPSHIGNLMMGRAFNKLGIISDGSNFDRHKELFGWH